MTFNLMLSEEKYVRFLTEHQLTQGQYLLLHLVYKSRLDLIREYKEKFPSGDNTMIGEYFIKDLVTKGFLTEDNGKYKLTNKFLEIFIDKDIATNEIFEIYPKFYVKDGVNYPLTAMDRNTFSHLYDKAINSNVEEHLEVMEDIKFGIENDLINIGLSNFVKSQHWLAIRPKRLEGQRKIDIETRRDFEF